QRLVCPGINYGSQLRGVGLERGPAADHLYHLADLADFELNVYASCLIEFELDLGMYRGLESLSLDCDLVDADGQSGQVVNSLVVGLSLPFGAAGNIPGGHVCSGECGPIWICDLAQNGRRNLLTPHQSSKSHQQNWGDRDSDK